MLAKQPHAAQYGQCLALSFQALVGTTRSVLASGQQNTSNRGLHSPCDHWRALRAAGCRAGDAAYCTHSRQCQPWVQQTAAWPVLQAVRPQCSQVLTTQGSSKVSQCACGSTGPQVPTSSSAVSGITTPGANPQHQRSSSGMPRAGARPPTAGSPMQMQQPYRALYWNQESRMQRARPCRSLPYLAGGPLLSRDPTQIARLAGFVHAAHSQYSLAID